LCFFLNFNTSILPTNTKILTTFEGDIEPGEYLESDICIMPSTTQTNSRHESLCAAIEKRYTRKTLVSVKLFTPSIWTGQLYLMHSNTYWNIVWLQHFILSNYQFTNNSLSCDWLGTVQWKAKTIPRPRLARRSALVICNTLISVHRLTCPLETITKVQFLTTTSPSLWPLNSVINYMQSSAS